MNAVAAYAATAFIGMEVKSLSRFSRKPSLFDFHNFHLGPEVKSESIFTKTKLT